jgi:nicotinamide riboside kinase
VHGLRRFLAPEVYATFVERVGILGGESTGKSSLAAGLAECLGSLDTDRILNDLMGKDPSARYRVHRTE